MNQRIYDLALEVLKDYPTLESWTFTRSELEKFAELIIRECAKRSEELGNPELGQGLLKHFGVEE